ncbi:hypothetical protein C8F01DRAFT_1311418, partial [Mycena amicta]
STSARGNTSQLGLFATSSVTHVIWHQILPNWVVIRWPTIFLRNGVPIRLSLAAEYLLAPIHTILVAITADVTPVTRFSALPLAVVLASPPMDPPQTTSHPIPSLWYEPPDGRVLSPLAAHSSLAIGMGTEHAIEFYLEEHETESSGFLKLFFRDEEFGFGVDTAGQFACGSVDAEDWDALDVLVTMTR